MDGPAEPESVSSLFVAIRVFLFDSERFSLLVLCFNAMYQWTLFEFGYHMTDENLKNFQIVKQINSNEIGWTLGYMINQTNGLDPQYRPERLLTKGEFAGLLFLCISALILSLIVVFVAARSWRRTGYSAPVARN